MEAEQEVWIMSCIRSSIFLWKNEPIPFLVFPNLTAHSIRSLEGSVCVEHQSTFWQETLYTQLDGNLSHDPFQREKAVSIHLGQNFALEVHFWKPMFSLLLAPASARWAWHSVLDLLHFSWDCWETGTLVTPCSQNTATSSIGTAWWQCSVGGNPRRQQAGAAFFKERKNWYVRLVPFQFHVACQSA